MIEAWFGSTKQTIEYSMARLLRYFSYYRLDFKMRLQGKCNRGLDSVVQWSKKFGENESFVVPQEVNGFSHCVYRLVSTIHDREWPYVYFLDQKKYFSACWSLGIWRKGNGGTEAS